MPNEKALLDDLQRLADEIGGPPTSRDVRDHGKYTVATYRSTFGSWSNALEAAGFDTRRSGTEYDDEELLEELHRLADELGHPPTIEELQAHGRYSKSPYRKRFGSWSKALEAAGFDETRAKSDTREDILDELRRLAGELGHPPSKPELREHGNYPISLYRRHFGSWKNALSAAGFKTRVSANRIPKEKLLADLQRVAEEHENPPRQQTVREHGNHSPTTYRNRFGSWKDALRAAGIEPRRTRVSDETLLEELNDLAEELGDPPTLQEFRERSERSATTYYERFGSWRDALQSAGLKDRPPQEAIPREDLITELKRFADDLDKVPTQKEMDEIGSHHSDTYRRHFGTWTAALEAAELADGDSP